MSHKVALLANGQIDPELSEQKIRDFPILIAVDGGLKHCKKMQLYPQFIIGDFDSAPADLLAEFPAAEKIEYGRYKDESDLELAIEFALSKGFRSLVVFGGFGYRIDHAFYNLQLLVRFKDFLSFDNGKEQLFVVTNQMTIPCTQGQTISFFTLNEKATGITSEGLKWELQNAEMDHSSMSLSNIALKNDVQMNVESGHLICVLQFL
jgi:thiamine pyrophosphokinase